MEGDESGAQYKEACIEFIEESLDLTAGGVKILEVDGEVYTK